MPSPFTLRGAKTGARAALVLAPSIMAFGATFGVLAGVNGLSLAEAAVMSAIVCAGTAQFAALQIWTDPVSWAAVGFASLAMNSRYVLFSATLRPWFGGLSPGRAYGSLFFLYDSNWAMAMRDRQAGHEDAAHLIGGGLTMCVTWTAATMIGHAFGGLIGDPKRLGLDFMLIAFFATMAVGVWRGRSDLVPVVFAAAVAVLADRLLPSPAYIVVGALAGSIAGAWRYRSPAEPGTT